ncbi:hypothetical protein [Streptomyces sp. NPDC049744]|uniref:hypothetical protein n=1 Tax=Streptomyces sp. NPDC049744 TaxID=3154359 RepID=UPI0034445B32
MHTDGLLAFANSLERHLNAVVAGLSTLRKSGIIEGHVDRTKILKRQMFGRARFELLRDASRSFRT